ncbi:hypothetical protein ACQ4PT_031229 [Festuca glaucescens]
MEEGAEDFLLKPIRPAGIYFEQAKATKIPMSSSIRTPFQDITNGQNLGVKGLKLLWAEVMFLSINRQHVPCDLMSLARVLSNQTQIKVNSSKVWKCSDIHVKEFEEFMEIPPCTKSLLITCSRFNVLEGVRQHVRAETSIRKHVKKLVLYRRDIYEGQIDLTEEPPSKTSKFNNGGPNCSSVKHLFGYMTGGRMSLLEESLKKVDASDPFAICGIIDQFSQQPSLKGSSALNRLEIVNKCFSKRTVEEIISTLEQEAPSVAGEWVTVAIQSLRKASPTSLKISLASIREGRLQTVGECLRREYRMVCHVFFFFEQGKWMPPSLGQVQDGVVEKYFSKVDDPHWEDLNLPARLPQALIEVSCGGFE